MTANKQRGVVLIVALVLLLVVTLLGVAVMSGSALDMKMANNSQERQQAFNAAEAALSQAEAALMQSTAPQPSAFNSTCNNGLCFQGVNATSPSTCNVVPSSGTIPEDPWKLTNGLGFVVWGSSNASKHMNASNVSAQYIIEFRCYVAAASGTGTDAMFRITAYGASAASNANVMLQSTFRRSYPYPP